jgi:hypothetical protein
MQYLIIFSIIIVIILIISFILYVRDNIIHHNIVFSDIDPNCRLKRFGCCNDKITARLDQDGTNCRGF